MEKRLSLFVFISGSIAFLMGKTVETVSLPALCNDWVSCLSAYRIIPFQGGKSEVVFKFFSLMAVFFSVIRPYFIKLRKTPHTIALRWSRISFFLVLSMYFFGIFSVVHGLTGIFEEGFLFLYCLFLIAECKVAYALKTVQFETFSERLLFNLKNKWSPYLKDLVFLSLLILLAQIFLGTLLQYYGAGEACGVGVKSLLECPVIPDQNPNVSLPTFFLKLNLAHRAFSLVTTFLLFLSGFLFFRFLQSFKQSEGESSYFVFSSLLSVTPSLLVLVLLFTGLSFVTFGISAPLSLIHLLLSLSILGIQLWLYLEISSLEHFLYPEGLNSFFRDLVEITKPKLSLLVLVTSAVGVLISPEGIEFFQALGGLLLIGLVVTGSAALNCYIEVDIDKKMERTKNRSLPSGRLHPGVALLCGLLLISSGVLSLAYFYNLATSVLALIASLLYLYAYTPLKGKSIISLFVGAISGAIPPVLGRTLVTGDVDNFSLSLFLILFIWQLPHFLAISIFHQSDYKKAKIIILPSLIGLKGTKFFIAILTLVLALISLMPFQQGWMNTTYLAFAVCLGSAFFIYSLKGIFLNGESVINMDWARKYFWGSIIYLPALLGSMMLFK